MLDTFIAAGFTISPPKHKPAIMVRQSNKLRCLPSSDFSLYSMFRGIGKWKENQLYTKSHFRCSGSMAVKSCGPDLRSQKRVFHWPMVNRTSSRVGACVRLIVGARLGDAGWDVLVAEAVA
mmetsp:Transcript_43187/g.123514  ORF Transcript_43187/g.123514 Transcript_43187/m.123514 type:complete len:121 (-) Transcript_43187:138-500(-)